jgi:hypothetical protein
MDRQKILALLVAGAMSLTTLAGCGSSTPQDYEDDDDQGGYYSGYHYYGSSKKKTSIFSKLGSSAKGSASS